MMQQFKLLIHNIRINQYNINCELSIRKFANGLYGKGQNELPSQQVLNLSVIHSRGNDKSFYTYVCKSGNAHKYLLFHKRSLKNRNDSKNPAEFSHPQTKIYHSKLSTTSTEYQANNKYLALLLILLNTWIPELNQVFPYNHIEIL